ncbi:hypothetical protein [Pseudomonas sp. P108]|uniref:hypothetical protein n=1 Tax=Pseudomonas sp. P108 TaxID=1837993 RepID=UPI00293470CA|nr:hypothetical protein [Pseudomonas sp. P108]WNZ87582.1 hypothetical protein QOM10_30310 [Pseudomonas sp. P108]
MGSLQQFACIDIGSRLEIALSESDLQGGILLHHLKASLIQAFKRTRVVEVLGRPKRIDPFKPGSHPVLHRARAFFYGRYILCLMHLGYGVIVIGRAGSGKSYLLSKIRNLIVLKPDINLVLQGQRPELDVCRLPDGNLAIEEPNRFAWDNHSELFGVLRGRRVLFTAQSMSVVSDLELQSLFEDRLVVIFLGGREDFRRELRGQGLKRSAYFG